MGAMTTIAVSYCFEGGGIAVAIRAEEGRVESCIAVSYIFQSAQFKVQLA
jgi:hypothetical protein